VYHKASKSCVEIGGEKYKNNPTAFSQYAKKIEKILKNKVPKCKNNEVYSKKTKRCITIGGQTYKALLKKDPTFFSNQVNKINKFKLLKNPLSIKTSTYGKVIKAPPTCGVTQVYNKHTKRCVTIGSQAYRAALKKDPNVFDDQKNKISNFFKPQTPKSIPDSPSETLANLMKRMKSPVSPNETLANIVKKVTPMKKMLLKRQPVPKVSLKTRQLFMKKAGKILRRISANENLELNLKKIPSKVFVTKKTSVDLYYFDYFTKDIFSKKKTLERENLRINVVQNNFYKNFYKQVLKRYLNPDILDLDWYVKVQKYISSITERERYALFSYTKYGDVYVNFLERGMNLDYNRVKMEPLMYEFIVYLSDPKHSIKSVLNETGLTVVPPFMLAFTSKDFTFMMKQKSGEMLRKFYLTFRQELLKSRHFKVSFINVLIKNLADTISRTIKNSPPTTKPMVVYRGVNDSFFTSDDYSSKMKKDEVFRNKGFVSTSVMHGVAMNDFMKINSECCFKVITILPGTRCVPLLGLTHFGEEVEILLDRNVNFIIRDKYTTNVPVRPKQYYENQVLTKKVKVADIIIG
jgi:hypothetical protein